MTREEREHLRSKLIDRLENEGAVDLANKLKQCGEEVPLNCMGCGERRIGRVRCDQRWCPVCQVKIATQTSMRFERIAKASDARWLSMATFTAQHSVGSWMTPREMLRAFNKLRRLRWFKKRVRGGVVAMEVTSGNNGWHVHLHAIIDSTWFAVTESAPGIGATKESIRAKAKRSQVELSEQWSLCCKRSANVRVRRARGNFQEVCKEQLKYSVKGSDLVACKGRVAPIIRSMKGCRNVRGFGAWHNHPSIKREDPAPAMCKCGGCDWILERLVDKLFRDARDSKRKRR